MPILNILQAIVVGLVVALVGVGCGCLLMSEVWEKRKKEKY